MMGLLPHRRMDVGVYPFIRELGLGVPGFGHGPLYFVLDYCGRP